ncbi:hypothetical protein ACP4OV_017947 [Aristida adscensionis]
MAIAPPHPPPPYGLAAWDGTTHPARPPANYAPLPLLLPLPPPLALRPSPSRPVCLHAIPFPHTRSPSPLSPRQAFHRRTHSSSSPTSFPPAPRRALPTADSRLRPRAPGVASSPLRAAGYLCCYFRVAAVGEPRWRDAVDLVAVDLPAHNPRGLP